MTKNKENLLKNIYYGYEIYNIDRATAGLKKSISAYIENVPTTKISFMPNSPQESFQIQRPRIHVSDYQVPLDFFKKNMKVFSVGR